VQQAAGATLVRRTLGDKLLGKLIFEFREFH
jgi:hypothetical protein